MFQEFYVVYKNIRIIIGQVEAVRDLLLSFVQRMNKKLSSIKSKKEKKIYVFLINKEKNITVITQKNILRFHIIQQLIKILMSNS